MINYGDIVHNSLVDWDGMTTDVIFFNGCNFRCLYCQNHQLIMRDNYVEADDILELINVDFIDGVVFSGGEPCLQPESLEYMMSHLKEHTELKIAIETNGSRPDIIDELSPYLDQVFMDFKSSPYGYELDLIGTNGDDVSRTFESMELCDNLKIPLELRTTCFANLITSKTIDNMGEYIDSTFRYEPAWVLQQGHVDDVLDSDIFNEGVVYSPDEMMELGEVGREYTEDMYVTTQVNGRVKV